MDIKGACQDPNRFSLLSANLNGKKVSLIRYMSVLIEIIKYLGNMNNITDYGPLPPLVPPILHSQGHTSQSYPHEYDDEHSSNVLDGDTVRLVVLLLAFHGLWVIVPPDLFELLQFTFV